jgi:hypothetical protein
MSDGGSGVLWTPDLQRSGWRYTRLMHHGTGLERRERLLGNRSLIDDFKTKEREGMRGLGRKD